jgi:mannose-6-phosphate isomerase-like protein (cupin superfamily)
MNRSADSAGAVRRRRRQTTVGVLVVAAVGAAVVFGATRAWATPGSGVTGPIVARGSATQDVMLAVARTVTVSRNVRVRVGARMVTRRVRVQVPGFRRLMGCGGSAPCEIAFQHLTMSPGGHTGWHTHPGPTFVAVAQGEGTLYHGVSGCPAHKYGAGTAFFQPTTEVHNFRNEGTTPLVFFAFYMLPQGTPNTAIRTDQPQPASCTNIP